MCRPSRRRAFRRFAPRRGRDFLRPAGTPPEIIARLNREFTAIINDPDFRARFMVKPGLEPSEIGLADIRAFMAQDRAGWEPLVKTSGVQLQ